MSTELADRSETQKALVPQKRAGLGCLEPQSFAEMLQFAEMISVTNFIPKVYQGKPGDILACIAYGGEIGFKPMQALQSICVINGMPSMYGDSALALCRNATDIAGNKLLEEFEEGLHKDDSGKVTGAWCRSKRRGHKEIVTDFTIQNAIKAQLLGKAGPWTTYPERMLKWRARGFNLRDNFPDVLKGLICAEEAEDMPSADERDQGHSPIPPSFGAAALKDRLLGRKPAAPVVWTKEEAVKNFSEHAESCGFEYMNPKDLSVLACILCGKDKAVTADLQAACQLGTPVWTNAILEFRKRSAPEPDPTQPDTAPVQDEQPAMDLAPTAALPLDEPDPFGDSALATEAQMDAIRKNCASQRRDMDKYVRTHANTDPENLTSAAAELLIAKLAAPVHTAVR